MDSGHVIVPQGWQREVTVGEEFVYYVSPDKQILRNREELLLHLTSQGTCKCGLRCPFRFDEQFSFDPTVIGLPDNSAYMEETQSLCKIGHRYRSETTINVTSAKRKPRANSSTKLHVPKTSPSMAQRFTVSASSKKREGVKRLQALKVSGSTKSGRHDVKVSNIKLVENSTGAKAKDLLQVPKSSEALVKVGSSTAECSPSSRNATLATLLKSSRDLSWLTNLCTTKLPEPSQQQGKQESLQVSVPDELANSSPTAQNVTKSMHAVEEKSILGDEISEASSAVLQNSPLQRKEELKVSIVLGKASTASGEGSDIIKTLMVSIPRGESVPETEPQAESRSEPGVDSSPTGIEACHNQVEPNHDEYISRRAEMESRPAEMEMEPSPTEMEPRPTEMESRPTKMEPRPTEMESRPAKMEPRPTEMEPRPTEMESRPAEMEPRPTEMEPRPESRPAEMEMEPRPAEIESRLAEMESSCGALNESRSSEETLSASESELQGVDSESGGVQEPDFQKGQRGSDHGVWQCLGNEETDLGEVQTLASSQQGKEDVRQEILSASAGSAASTDGGGVHLPADKLMDAESGDSVTGYSAVGTHTSETPDSKSNGTSTFVTKGELGDQGDDVKSLQIVLPHFSPLAELPVSTATPSVFSEFTSLDPADLQENYSTTETTHSPNPGSVQQSDTDLQITAALASNSVASESNASFGVHSQGVLCASSHVSSLPVPRVGTKCYGGWNSGSRSEKPEVHSLVMNGTHSASDQAEQVSAVSIPPPYVQEPVTDELEEVLLIPIPDVPSNVQAGIPDSANSQCLTGNSVPCSATLLDTPHCPTPSIPPTNGVSLLADPSPTKPSATSTHAMNSKSLFAPVSTNGVPTSADPSQLHPNRAQEVGVLAENAGFFTNNSSTLRIPCASTFLSPKRSPSKDIVMRDFHISIKPLREFTIRKRRSSEMFETEEERYRPDVGWGPSPKRQRFVSSKVVGEKTVEGSLQSFEGGQASESEVPSALREPTAGKGEEELPAQQDSESTKLVAVLPRDLNIADLISMLQDSVPNSGTETNDNILRSEAIGALAAQIVDVAGTQGYVEGASSILVLSHQSPELEAILQAAVTQQVESARPPNAGSGTATDHLASDICFELGTIVPSPSLPDKCDSVPSKKRVNLEEPALSEATPEEQQVASLSTLAEAVGTVESIQKGSKDVCHSPEQQGGDNEVRISPDREHSIVAPLEIHPQKDVHPQTLQDQDLQSISPPLDEPEQSTCTAAVLFQHTKELITPYLKSYSDSVPVEQPPAIDKDGELSRPSFGGGPTTQNHIAAVEVQGENSADVKPDLVGRQTGLQQTPTAQVEAENVSNGSVNADEKSSMEVAVDVLLQLSRQFTSSTSEVDSPGDLEMKDQTTGGVSVESVALNPCSVTEAGVTTVSGIALNPCNDTEAAVTTVSRVSECKDLNSEQQKEEVTVKMEEIPVENLAGLTKEPEVQSSDVANVNHTAGTIGSEEIGGLESGETMKNDKTMKNDDVTAAEAVCEQSNVHVSECFDRLPDMGPSGLQEEKAVKSENTLATSPKVIMQQKSSSPEEEEEGRLVRESMSEPPPCSRRSRNQPSFTSLDQDADPLMSSSGSGFSFLSCSDTPGRSTSSGKQSSSPTTSTSTKSPTPVPISERPPISRGKHKPTPISPPHPKRLIVSIPLDKVSIIHYSVLECYPTPVFGVGDIVWAKAALLPGWPGRIISHSERKRDKLKPPPKGMFWVEWFGDGTISLVEEETVRTLKEGINNRKMGKKGRKNKIPRQLQEAMQEALKAQKKQLKGKKKS